MFFFLLSITFSACSPLKNNYVDVDMTTIFNYIGSPQPVYLRMVVTECRYAKPSKPYWEEASRLFPTVIFAEIDCLKSSAAGTYCAKLQGGNGPPASGIKSPSHEIFTANSKDPIINSLMYNPQEISEGSSKYVEEVIKWLKIQPIVPPIQAIIPSYSDNFFSNYEFPVFVLYNSGCLDDNNYLEEWTKEFDVELSPKLYDFSLGKIDCKLYPSECQRWGGVGYKTPSTVVYYKNGASTSFNSRNDLTSTLTESFSRLKSIGESKPTPTPVPIVPEDVPQPPPGVFSRLYNTKLQNRDLEELRNKYIQEIGSTLGNEEAFTRGTGTCDLGTHNQKDIDDSFRVFKLFREFAGVPNDVTYRKDWQLSCQQLALVLHNFTFIIHYPNVKPGQYCMPTTGWEQINRVGALSNLAQGDVSMLNSIIGLTRDPGDNNLGQVGHRRWQLHPYLQSVSMGYIGVEKYTPPGSSVQFVYPSIGVLRYNDDDALISYQKYPDHNFTSWPSAGPFPADQIPESWSISFDEFNSNPQITVDDLVVIITRDDGTQLKYKRINIDRSMRTMADALVIQLTASSLELCVTGREIHVEVYIKSLLKCIDYTFTIFSPEPKKDICFYSTSSDKCPQNSIAFGPSSNYVVTAGNVENFQVVSLTIAEPIELGNKIFTVDFCQKLYINSKGANMIKGKIIINPGVTVDIMNAQETEFEVKSTNSFTNTNGVLTQQSQYGQLISASKPKLVTLNIEGKIKIGYNKFKIYEGPYPTFKLNQQFIDYDELDYTVYFAPVFDNSKIYLETYSRTNLLIFRIIGSTALTDTNAAKAENPINIAQLSDISGYSTFKNKIKIYGGKPTKIDVNCFIPNSYIQYEFILDTDANLRPDFVYSWKMEFWIESLKIRSAPTNNGPAQLKVTISENAFEDPAETGVNRYLIDFPIHLDLTADGSTYVGINELKGNSMAVQIFNNGMYFKKITEFDTQGSVTVTKESYFYQHASTFVTKGLSSYTINYNRQTDKAQNRKSLEIKPAPGYESSPVKISLYDSSTMTKKLVPLQASNLYEFLWVANYQNLELDANLFSLTHLNGKNYSSIQLLNCGKVKFLITKPLSLPETQVRAGKTESTIGGPSGTAVITYDKVIIESGSLINGENAETPKLVVGKLQTEVKNLKVTDSMEFTDTQITLDSCKFGDDVTILLKKSTRWPLMNFKNLAVGSFSPRKITLDLGSSSKLQLLETVTENHTIINGIPNQNECDGLLNSFEILNNGEGFEKICAAVGNSYSIKISKTYEIVNPPGPADPNPTSSTKNSGGLSGGAIAGVVIGVILVVAIAVVGGIIFLKYKKNAEAQTETNASQL